MIGINGKINDKNALIIPYSLLQDSSDDKLKSIDSMISKYYSGKCESNFFLYYIRKDKGSMNPSTIESQVISGKWGIVLSKDQLLAEHQKTISIESLKMDSDDLKDDPSYYFLNTPAWDDMVTYGL